MPEPTAPQIHSQTDLFEMLDALLRPAQPFWDGFYQDRTGVW